jgi:flavin reductase (DIM6/NTAB) family NADH-FMN oxidoreductase RutF
MLFYEPQGRDREVLPHDPFKAFIAPRPIGWVSTVGPDGEVNLAPYSYFNAVCDRPPMVMFSSGGPKDSATFAHSGGEFVWNMATWDLREQMNETSRTVPRGVNEFERAGLTMTPSRLVAPPRVAESPVALECKYWKTVELPVETGREAQRGSVVFGQVVGVHIDDSILKDGRVDVMAFRPVARLGYSEYTTTENVWKMRRPDDSVIFETRLREIGSMPAK